VEIMHALEGLQIYYNTSKEGDIYHTIVGILLKNIHKISSCTIYDIADLCYVSPATISRLSKKLGYSGFPDFKISIVNAVKNYEVLNQYVSVKDKAKYDSNIASYLELLELQLKHLKEEISTEELDNMAHIMNKCKNIKFYTNGIIFAEHRFQGDLIMAGHMCEIKTSPLEQMSDIRLLGKEDMVIMISPVVHEGANVLEIMKKVKEQGARLFVLTDAQYPPYKRYADYYYCFEGALGIIDDYRFAMYLNLVSIRFRELFLS
jgi:DNA-binding MurR/RpiR family transcriptional regulator